MSDLSTEEPTTAAVLTMIEAAMDEVIRIIKPDQRIRMSIPAQPKYDTDLLIMDALKAAKDALGRASVLPTKDNEVKAQAWEEAAQIAEQSPIPFNAVAQYPVRREIAERIRAARLRLIQGEN